MWLLGRFSTPSPLLLLLHLINSAPQKCGQKYGPKNSGKNLAYFGNKNRSNAAAASRLFFHHAEG